jgi:DNA gyrase subunit A
MIDADLELSSAQLCRYVKGPDFPTGGQIMNTAAELKEIYTTGSGTVRIRATWEEGPASRTGKTIYITSIPYAVNKATLVERIAEVVLSRKLPHLLDVRDVSTDDVRIALQLKGDADKRLVMAYLYKHTPLQSTFPVNLTCLVPTENALVGKPERLELHEILWQFLHFRLEVVRARLKNELEGLEKRIHVLEGFETVFDALDEILQIVRKSDGKADAAEKIMKRFELDAEQTDAILELKIYRLARLEILVIQQELATRRKRAKEIGGLLKREEDLWKIVRAEIEAVQKTYGDARRSILTGEAPDEESTADDFIIDGDNVVVVTHDGWV